MFRKKIDYNKQINSIDNNQMAFIIKHGKRVDTLKGIKCKSFFEYSVKIIKQELPELLKDGKYIEVARLLLNSKLKGLKANDLLSFILFVLDELEQIAKNELANLNSPPDFDLQMAGIDKLDKFGVINIIDQLAGGDVTKWEDCWELSYGDAFVKLCKNNVEREIQKNYQKIIEQKHKR